MQVAGKTAIVTGSAVGVGRETALELADAARTSLSTTRAPKPEAKQTLADVEALGAKALLVRADVSRDDEVRAMVSADRRAVRRRRHPRQQRRR